MASCNFRKPAACASVRQRPNWLYCCLMILAITVMKEACATTVLHNKAGRDLVLIIPQQHLKIEVPAGQSVDLELEQQRRVVIQDVKTGAVAGPLNLPNSPSLEVVQLDHPASTYTSASVSDVQVTGSFQLGGFSTSFAIRASTSVGLSAHDVGAHAR